MTIVVKNIQKSIQFNIKILQYQTSVLVKLFGIENYDIGIVCINKKYIQKLNRVYRNTNRATDVLAFPYYHNIIPGALPKPNSEIQDYNLGDIFLCLSVIQEQCLEDKKDFQSSLPIYITHGISHLLGYSHNTKDSWRKMLAKETEILSLFGQITHINCTPLTNYKKLF